MTSTPVAYRATAAAVLALALYACQRAPESPAGASGPAAAGQPPAAPSVAAPAPVAPASSNGDWPAVLNVFGEGFPNPGDPCRNVGESAVTADFLDHTAWLVGCRSEDDALRLGGRVVARIEGVTLVSVPRQLRPPRAATRARAVRPGG